MLSLTSSWLVIIFYCFFDPYFVHLYYIRDHFLRNQNIILREHKIHVFTMFWNRYRCNIFWKQMSHIVLRCDVVLILFFLFFFHQRWIIGLLRYHSWIFKCLLLNSKRFCYLYKLQNNISYFIILKRPQYLPSLCHLITSTFFARIS